MYNKNWIFAKIRTMKVQGFSLAELMIAVAIMIILATVGTSTYTAQIKRGRDQQRIADLARIQAALEEYYAIEGQYPAEISGCDTSTGICNCTTTTSCGGDSWAANSSLETLVVEGYMDELPIDPKNDNRHYYYYEVTKAGETEGDPYCDGQKYTCKPYAANCMYTLTVNLEATGDEYCIQSIYTTSAVQI